MDIISIITQLWQLDGRWNLLHEITDVSHALLEPFLEIRRRNWTEHSGLFIAEGPLLVQALIASDYRIRSILLDRKYLQHYRDLVPDAVDLLLVDHALVQQIVGFNFHRGVLGCGLRKPLQSIRDANCLDDNCLSWEPQETLVALHGVQDPENVGGILRSCAGLGVRRVLIGPGTSDPLSRRALRVSMGTALKLEIFRSQDLLADLHYLRESQNITSIATSLQPGSVPLERATREGSVVILLGNERYGLPADLQEAAQHRVGIAMDLGTDSLNVSVAAGIVIHHYCRTLLSRTSSR